MLEALTRPPTRSFLMKAALVREEVLTNIANNQLVQAIISLRTVHALNHLLVVPHHGK